MKTIICGGTIVTEKEAFRGDLLIGNGRILKTAGHIGPEDPEAG